MDEILFQLRRWWRETRAFLAGTGRPPITVDQLLEQLDSWWPWQAARAARALRSFRDPDVVAALIRALRRPYGSVQGAAIDSLAEIGGQEALRAVAEVLAWEGGWPLSRIRRQAAAALGRRGGEESLLPLCEALEQDPDPAVRGAAAAALGQMWMRGAVNPLVAVRRELQELSRRFAVRPDLSTAPGIARLLEAIPPALQELRDSEHYGTEMAVLDRVGRALCRTVENDWRTSAAEQAIVALSHLGDSRAIATLIRALRRSSNDPSRRQTVCLALRRIVQHLAPAPDPADLLPLVQAAGVSDRAVQEAAGEGLCNLVAEFRRGTCPDPTSPLIQLLQVPQPPVRLRAIQALGAVGDARALSALQAETHLFSNVAAPEIKAAAMEAIAAIEARVGTFSNRELSRAPAPSEPVPTERSLTRIPSSEEAPAGTPERLTEPAAEAESAAEQTLTVQGP
jgi:HEAT repeat protein